MRQKALTMEWILEPRIAQCVADAVQHVNERLSSLFARPSPVRYQMVIGVKSISQAEMRASYYLVDLDEETVFWVDKYELRWRKVSRELRRRETVGLFLQYEFQSVFLLRELRVADRLCAASTGITSRMCRPSPLPSSYA